MNLGEFITQHQPIDVEPHVIVSNLMVCSRAHARRLIQQGGVSVTRNEASIKLQEDDLFLLGDLIKIGKGRFYQL